MRSVTMVAALLAGIGAVPAFAQAPTPAPAAAPETVEVIASEAEMTGVRATLEKIGCTAEVIEKENADLFEVDDASCAIGQYDVKLDADFSIISMTRD